MKEYFFNKAYEFYPKNLNGLDETYMEKSEIKKMRFKIESSLKREYVDWIGLINDFNEKNNLFYAIDKSNFSLNQPSLALQIMIQKKSSFLLFNYYSSLIIPYFYFNLTTHELSDKLFKNIISINSYKEINEDIIELMNRIKFKSKKDIIPKEYLYEIIPDLSFEIIPFGNFTIQNAFFNSKNLMI